MGTTVENQPRVVSIGIDAAVVAPHQIAIRGPGVAEDFRVRPTLAGLEELTVRLADWAPAMVVAEPTAGTWLPFLHAIRTAIANIVGQDNRRIPTARQDGTDRCGAQVAELTDELDLWGWPEGTKFIVRCERRDLGAQQSLFPFEAFRYWGHDNRRRRR